MIPFKSYKFIKNKRGFAVLFSILLASFLITLGISIFSISLKEVQIATSVRDSQVAYYIADSARECALYNDVKVGAFPTCLDSSCSGSGVAPATMPIYCNGNPIILNFQKNGLIFSTQYIDANDPNKNSDHWPHFFDLNSTDPTAPEADVKITKEYIPSTNSIKTTIDAFGHNTGIIGRRVERGMRQVINQ